MVSTPRPRRTPDIRLAAAIVCGLLAGCGTQPPKEPVALGEFIRLFPGHYDNLQQSAGPQASDSLALQITIVPAYVPLLGEHVFYIHENVAGDPRRVTSQQLLVVQAAPKGTDLMAVPMLFKEPEHWRDGARDADVFKSLLPQDVRAQPGCTLTWHRVVEGFDGATAAARCVVSTSGSEPLHVDRRLQLRRDSLTLTERRTDDSGRVVSGDASDASYVLRRRTE